MVARGHDLARAFNTPSVLTPAVFVFTPSTSPFGVKRKLNKRHPTHLQSHRQQHLPSSRNIQKMTSPLNSRFNVLLTPGISPAPTSAVSGGRILLVRIPHHESLTQYRRSWREAFWLPILRSPSTARPSAKPSNSNPVRVTCRASLRLQDCQREYHCAHHAQSREDRKSGRRRLEGRTGLRQAHHG